MRRGKGITTYAESVAPDVVWTDGQVTNLKALHAMDIQALIYDTAVRCNGASLPRRHAASSKGMPGSLDVAFD
jgi:hypothetical protein